jgi:uncharacterized protein (TIGR02145 family)
MIPNTFDSDKLTITTTTDNPAGYTTTISTNSPTETCLRRPSDGTTCANAAKTIKPAAGTVTSSGGIYGSTLAVNQWGASAIDISSTSNPDQFGIWFGVPDNSNAALISKSIAATPTAGTTTDITIGAKVDYSLPATTTGDEYKNTILITATANTYVATPTITAVAPNVGPIAGGQTIVITGTNFDTAYEVFIDKNTNGIQDAGEACTDANIDSATQITCTTPAGTVGTYDVVVKTWGGATKTTSGPNANSADNYTYQYPATIVPNIASTRQPGGNGSGSNGPQFSIYGSDFGPNPTVTISGAPCTDVVVNSAGTAITCTGPTNAIFLNQAPVKINNITTTAIVTYDNTNYPTLQSLTAATCSTTPTIYRDSRDSQLYYVKKLDDGKCWMIDNLKYKPNGDTTGTVTASFSAAQVATDTYLTADGTGATGTNYDNYNAAKYIDPVAEAYCNNNTDKPATNITKCGLLYNFYTATAGVKNTVITGNATSSICPSNWHLPTGRDVNGDFAVLNGSMYADQLSTGSIATGTGYYQNWQYSGDFAGIYTGSYTTSSFALYPGEGGYFWSSSVESESNSYYLGFTLSTVNAGRLNNARNYGFGVRCVIESITVSSVSPEIASTTPGSESGPAFSIVGNNFTGATNVTIGGQSCSAFTVVSSSLIECTGPNTALSAGDQAVVVSRGTGSSNTNISVAYNADTYPTLQSGAAYAQCETNARIFRDSRDSQLYYVKKMPDNKCWMVDNLKYVDRTVANSADGTSGMTLKSSGYNTVNGTSAQSSANSDKAFYNTPMGTDYCTGDTDMPADTVTRCGYLYNWYAATGGTGTYDQATHGNNMPSSICPAGFRLPSSYSGTSGPTTNGAYYTAADFPVLNASMENGGLAVGSTDTSYYEGWIYSGAWQGVHSGHYISNSISAAGAGRYWSSTTASNANARYLYFNADTASVNTGVNSTNKYYGFAVRCVKDPDPTPEPPAGTNPPNVSPENPIELDVYPTTGWEGDVVAITSNAQFTNVESVSIGGAACLGYNVVSSSLIACRLPVKTAGSTNDIVVMNSGVNLTDASVFNHMRITYFNPDVSTVTIGGTTYGFYPNGFSSTNCEALTASNSTADNLPNSIAYVRDVRNKQTYRVKRMVDNKCWMIDNLKYIDTGIYNSADGTTGMVYNSGDHLGNGGTTAFNTVDETNAQSAANYDKAFWNNPMHVAYCYGNSDMPLRSLTRCGYLYNWYSATAGTGTYALTSSVHASGSICPAGFRLPSSYSGTGGPTTTGLLYLYADWPVLNASMYNGSLANGSQADTADYFKNWVPTGAWQSVRSGLYNTSNGTGLTNVGTMSFYWSADAATTGNRQAFIAYFTGTALSTNSAYLKYYGMGVRCLMGV